VLAQDDISRLAEGVDDRSAQTSFAALQTSPGARYRFAGGVRIQTLGQVTNASRVTAQFGVCNRTKKYNNINSFAQNIIGPLTVKWSAKSGKIYRHQVQFGNGSVQFGIPLGSDFHRGQKV